ncbi:DNA helicase [Sphingobium sp. TA15]|uniref:ATP-dependent DNA helicase DinG n=1 Tax=Sphingobium indicum (strain DSM 16413 / CCM 7287 / MTCC 6362 / UT26 / NBRC 101211 / UT26S) TaxID=452662 RepID=D4Z646_SPHIU|nr:ATP-dependent DNA helicase [Sphingobium indicum]BAI98078.1 ATP-dependent DNA helicase DinG [Sphingobium indicum UT26S]BDD67455.1 DNA helicase [Sphingobium sp. TA15]
MIDPAALPALHASHGGIWLREADRTAAVAKGTAIARTAETPTLLLNAPLTGQRLGYPDLNGLDLLELWAFIHPARFLVPTPKGLAEALDLPRPASESDIPELLQAATAALLATLESSAWTEREGGWTAAQALHRLRWPWAPLLAGRIATPKEAERWLFSKLPEWEENPPRPAPRTVTLQPDAVVARLEQLTGAEAEARPGQRAYAAAAAEIFRPRAHRDQPNMLLAEAGTGIGKTLGYLAPASLWAGEAQGTVWISTYTKALQRQLDRESLRLFPDPAVAAKRVVVRKGRENYLCLLNLEDALQGGFAGRAAILAQLVARWAAFTKDGDMIGGDLPGWLPTLFRRNGSTALTDRRGECIYAGCPHYRKCFIERSARASADADIVIANHALVMINAARGRETGQAPQRIVFDEGHHLFDAADSTFSVALSGQEAIELRRWVMGPEGNARGRRRGLAARLSDLASYDEQGGEAIRAAAEAARALPADEWLKRIVADEPFGPVEQLLAAVRGTVYARAADTGEADAGYGLETELAEPDGALVEAAQEAARALDNLLRPLTHLGKRMEAVIEEAPDWLDGAARARVEGAIASLGWRRDLVTAWLALLARIGGPADPDFVDWLAVERIEGREFDIGIHRHWLDPTRPLAQAVLKPAQGVLITSATLKGGGDWDNAASRSGANHLPRGAEQFEANSPFDYPERSEVLIVTDIKRGDIAALSGAYARLIEAAGGGTLGLFTAIRRLRAVHARIADRLARAGLPLYAQHVDPMDTGTLIDIFRDDPRASLLGTDALRDGVDVPGHSLRLVVMEGVPWSKPTVLHAARKLAGGGSAYDDRLIRARMAQAFGRLIRRAEDRGSFVILSAAMPSRLLSAFPPGTPIRRLTLDEAIISVSGQSRAGHGSHAALGHQQFESGT